MPSKAIGKLQSEMTQNNTDSYIQVVGAFLLQHLEQNPKDAEKIMVTDKTIGKSLEQMRKEASKKKVGSCAVLTDQEGFEVVLKYFGIKATTPASARAAAPIITSDNVQPNPSEPKSNNFNVNLEDFL